MKNDVKTYDIKGVRDEPTYRVFVDGEFAQSFTSLSAAKAWIEHMQKLERAYVNTQVRR